MDCPGSLERFPTGWTDPLELYGEYIHDLKSFGCNMEIERKTLKGLIDKHGAKWVWCNRHKLVPVAKGHREYAHE
jgi:hypothetical protein